MWLFDPQGIAGTERPSFWWDPLDACRTIAAARRIADVFASASRPPNASRDAYFDPASEELLASYLLAAAAGGEPVTAVHAWLANDRDDTARAPPARRRAMTPWPTRPKPPCTCPTASSPACSAPRPRSWPGWPTPDCGPG